MSFFEAWNLPVWMRSWWMDRTNKHIEQENERQKRHPSR